MTETRKAVGSRRKIIGAFIGSADREDVGAYHLGDAVRDRRRYPRVANKSKSAARDEIGTSRLLMASEFHHAWKCSLILSDFSRQRVPVP
ncbi:hypothetical protein IY145_00805 [Methylosinus sp. H3A]|uniref:hypothetical protein n=1 Tax=Methylosinus sp. H3A TaxID=2785786 RepID=UPI0018C242DB|nr:hypothetical protein [Methylosinus sp. H3A]MBG0807969.1 hypothetical protein [Methylosinus sp. H3A]